MNYLMKHTENKILSHEKSRGENSMIMTKNFICL